MQVLAFSLARFSLAASAAIPSSYAQTVRGLLKEGTKMNDNRLLLRQLGICLLVLVTGTRAARCQDRALAPGLGFTRDFVTEYPAPGHVYSMAVHDDGTGPQLYLGGEFYEVNNILPFMSRNIVRWNGSQWSRVSWGVDWTQDNPDPGVFALCSYDSGSGPLLYLTGSFTRYWSTQQNAWRTCGGILTWNGIDLELPATALSNHVYGTYGVRHMAVFDDGGGEQLYFGGVSYEGVWRWDGQSCTRAGTATGSDRLWFCVHDEGNGPRLFTAGILRGLNPVRFGLSAWDGAAWSEIPVPTSNLRASNMSGMVSIDHGDGPTLYLSFWNPDNLYEELWRYRAGVWDQPLANSVGGQQQYYLGLATYDDGNGPALYVTGRILMLPGFPAGMSTRLARFDGTSWEALAPIIPIPIALWFPSASAVYNFGEGADLYLGGEMGGSGGQSTIRLTRYRGAHRDLVPVCGGDGSLRRCPCNSRGAVGYGCPNSTNPSGARLTGQGSGSGLLLSAESLPANALAILYQGDDYAYSPPFSGDGVRCTTGTVLRLGTSTAQAGAVAFPGAGETSLRARAAVHGDSLPSGCVRYYQVWYRDSNPAFCESGGLFNITNGMRVVW